MRPVSSGLDTLTALATRCAGNVVLRAAPALLIVRREEAAPRSRASLMFFIVLLPFCIEVVELVFPGGERAGHGIVPGPTRSAAACLGGRLPTSITSLHDDHGHRRRRGLVSGPVTSNGGQRMIPQRVRAR